MKFIGVLLYSLSSFALDCTCDVQVMPPITASHQLSVNPLNSYSDDAFENYNPKNQQECRNFCQEKFLGDYHTERLNAVLLSYSLALIDQKQLGYNCTGLTTLKFPVRVKARLGRLSLGNVIDQIQVINHEEECF